CAPGMLLHLNADRPCSSGDSSMWLKSVRPFLERGSGGRPMRRNPTARRRSFVPRLEILESRTVPTTFAVLNNLDSGAGSLRQAVLDANANPGPDVIAFAKAVHQITLTGGELMITDSLNIQGPGANKLAVSGNDASRIFHIGAGATVTLAGLTMSHGHA